MAIDPQNPLTARVAVKSVWQNFFGQRAWLLLRGISEIRTIASSSGNCWIGCIGTLPRLSGWMLKVIQRLWLWARPPIDQSSKKQGPELEKKRILTITYSPKTIGSFTCRNWSADNARFAAGLLNQQWRKVIPLSTWRLWRVNGGNYVQDTVKTVIAGSIVLRFGKLSSPSGFKAIRCSDHSIPISERQRGQYTASGLWYWWMTDLCGGLQGLGETNAGYPGNL